MKIDIETIPHSEQRYSTCGDWFYTDGWEKPKGTEMGPSSLWLPIKKLHIRVSKLPDPRFEFLVALHELVEVKLCEWSGVTQKQVDDFDMDFEKHRHPDDDSEPGDSPDAPYRFQHCLATGVERIVAAVLGVDWSAYEKAINALFE